MNVTLARSVVRDMCRIWVKMWSRDWRSLLVITAYFCTLAALLCLVSRRSRDLLAEIWWAFPLASLLYAQGMYIFDAGAERIRVNANDRVAAWIQNVIGWGGIAIVLAMLVFGSEIYSSE